ncbi:hypothetical protein [Vreelandella populi]|uniref:hypothetical protein n=1 Tax=Vreelandella populi TaxID=2498858 RepID=UPI000F8E92E5|nr:hypothetical protein [Halomonas populi]RUR38535.1 hypothetical protein ELY25_09230 [Halomonas populi]
MLEAIIALVVMLTGAIGVLLKQRNTARKKADDANRAASHERAAREIEQRINDAGAKARKESAETQREADNRPATDRPTGSFRR